MYRRAAKRKAGGPSPFLGQPAGCFLYLSLRAAPPVCHARGAVVGVDGAAVDKPGAFQQMLNDFPASTLSQSIPDFHNTPLRYQRLLDAVKKDPLHRVRKAEP